MEQNTDQEINPYTLTDVGELYQKISSASDDELEKIKEEGISRPHSGLVERIYEILNERVLREKKADEEQITRFLNAYAAGDLKEMVSVAQTYSMKLSLPTQKELDRGLRNAVVAGEYSIDEKGTSAGWFYQMLYGDDCQRIARKEEFTEKIPGENGQTKEEPRAIVIPYEKFSQKEKEHINKQILVKRGYLSKDELEKPEQEQEKQ